MRLLKRNRAQRVEVEDEDTASGYTNQAVIFKLFEDAVNHFAGRTDHFGKFLLRKQPVEDDAFIMRLAFQFGARQQHGRQPRCHIPKG